MTYLAHHGILGQKWGVRRYQNEDGSLTELGRKRLGYKDSYIPRPYYRDGQLSLIANYPSSYSRSTRNIAKKINDRELNNYLESEFQKKKEARERMPENERNKELKDAYEFYTRTDTPTDMEEYDRLSSAWDNVNRDIRFVSKIIKGYNFWDNPIFADYAYEDLTAISHAANRGKRALEDELLRKKDWNTPYEEYAKQREQLMKSEKYTAYANAEKFADEEIVTKLLKDTGFSDTPETRKIMEELAFANLS